MLRLISQRLVHHDRVEALEPRKSPYDIGSSDSTKSAADY